MIKVGIDRQKVIRYFSEMKLQEIHEVKENFNNHLSRQLKRLEEEWEQKLGKELNEITPDYDRYLQDYFEDEYYKLTEAIPNIFRKSLVIYCHTFLETQLMKLCNYIYYNNDKNITVNDLTGDLFKRVEKYLSVTTNIDSIAETHEWQELIKFHQIRNCITHADGNINDCNNRKKIQNIVKNSKNKLKLNGSLIITEDYLNDVVNCIKKLLEILFDQLFEEVQN